MSWIINPDSPRCGKYDTDECREDCPDFGSWKCLWNKESNKKENIHLVATKAEES